MDLSMVARGGFCVIAVSLVLSVLGAGLAGAAGGTRWGISGAELGYRYDPPGHNGEDVKEEPGTRIRALHSGCVFRVKDDDGVGGYHQEITVRYDKKGSTGKRWVLYGHTQEGSMRRENSCFERGDHLARVGSKSDANGSTPHAHVQVWKTADDATGYKNSATLNPALARKAYGEL